jgi:hypothetical protein
MVSGPGKFISGNRAAAVEFQFAGSEGETEEYSVELSGVTLLDLIIEPDKINYCAQALFPTAVLLDI